MQIYILGEPIRCGDTCFITCSMLSSGVYGKYSYGWPLYWQRWVFNAGPHQYAGLWILASHTRAIVQGNWVDSLPLPLPLPVFPCVNGYSAIGSDDNCRVLSPIVNTVSHSWIRNWEGSRLNRLGKEWNVKHLWVLHILGNVSTISCMIAVKQIL